MRKFSGLKRSTFKIFETIYFKISFMRLRLCMLLVLILGILNTKKQQFYVKNWEGWCSVRRAQGYNKVRYKNEELP